MSNIDHLIINSPYTEPEQHWRYDHQKQTFERKTGRRPAGYFVAGQGVNAEIGEFKPIPLVNEIRKRLKAWKKANYPGITGITRKLLNHWNDESQRDYQFFSARLTR